MVHTGALVARNRDRNDAEMQRQRLQMLNGAVEAQEQIDGDAIVGSGSGSNVTWMKIKRFFIRLSPFSSDLRQIESRFGNSVASYFKFFRWFILCFITGAIPCTYLLSMHIMLRLDEVSTICCCLYNIYISLLPISCCSLLLIGVVSLALHRNSFFFQITFNRKRSYILYV
jgi:hypothetical protein